MVAAEIGEAGGGEAHAVEPALVEAVARRLERRMCDAFAAPARSSIACSATGSGVVRLPYARAVGGDDAERAELAAVWPACAKIWRAKAATEVLPLVPVTATSCSGWRG